MKINIYDEAVNRVLMIGDHYVSCYWVEGFNTTGQFTLELQAKDEYKTKIKRDYFVGRTDRKALMVVTGIEAKNDKIIVSGKTADRVLNDCAMMGRIRSYQDIDTTVKMLYNSSDKISGVEYADTNLGVDASMQISNKDFQTVSLSLAQKNNIGFRVTKGNGVAVAEFYLPQTKNAVFAEKYGNLVIDRLYFSNEKYKNYAIVLGEGEGESRARVDVDLSNGERKRQIVIDARDIQREEGETDEEYNQRLTDRGVDKLLELTQASAVGITVPPEEFGKYYDLGDIVTVLLDDFGIKFKTYIARVSQKAQRNIITTTVEIGDIAIVR